MRISKFGSGRFRRSLVGRYRGVSMGCDGRAMGTHMDRGHGLGKASGII